MNEPELQPSTPPPAESRADLFDATELDSLLATAEPQSGASRSESAAADVVLNRIEQSLAEMRAHMSATARESRHKDFSFMLLAGAVAQSLVVALLAWALSDCLFANAQPLAGALLKLGFATVLQLIALTAFLTSRGAR